MVKRRGSSTRFEDDGNTLIIESKHVETIYKRQYTGLTETRAKEIAKETREVYNRKSRAIKQDDRWSVYVEEQTWID